MPKNNYDIVIVGAGPAGSLAAKSAAENGADVLMIDKRRELGVPVQCGEALPEEVLHELDIEPDSRWVVNKVNGTRLVSPSGKSVKIEQRAAAKIGFIIDRKVFDKHLAILAAKAGADIWIDTYVNGLIKEDGEIKGITYDKNGENGEVRSDLVIAADGVMSRVARWAGFDTKLGLEDIESGAQFKMVGVDFGALDEMKFYFGSDIAPGGYVWIFPKGEDVANVGIGVLPDRAEKASVEYLKDFVSDRPDLSKGKIVEENVGGVPVSGIMDKTYDDDILIVGDAARQVNSLTGGGIEWSMRAGAIAGRVGAEAVEEGDTSEDRLSEYQDEWEDVMGKKLGRYHKGKEVLLDLDDDELDDLADSLQGVDFGELSLTQMLKAVMKTSPKLMWKLKGVF